MANRIRKVTLTENDLGVLEERSRSRTLPQREVERARIALLSAAGKSNAEIQAALGVSRTNFSMLSASASCSHSSTGSARASARHACNQIDEEPLLF